MPGLGLERVRFHNDMPSLPPQTATASYEASPGGPPANRGNGRVEVPQLRDVRPGQAVESAIRGVSLWSDVQTLQFKRIEVSSGEKIEGWVLANPDQQPIHDVIVILRGDGNGGLEAQAITTYWDHTFSTETKALT